MTVGVYGLGRFGMLWAELLSRELEVVAFSRDSARLPPSGVRRVGEDEVAGADGLFLCVAISAMREVCGRLAPKVGERTLVMDTCSVKTYPVDVMIGALRPETAVMATHPMFGPDSVRAGVSGLPIVICPVRVEEPVVEGWAETFRRMGLTVLRMDADEHDRTAAYTQGITHFVGRILADMDLSPSAISTLGYRRLLEIIEQTCNDSWQLFLDLQHYNPYTAEMRARLKESIERMLQRLEP